MVFNEFLRPLESKNIILGLVDDLVSNFLYYDRKEDEEIPIGYIDQSIQKNLITEEEIVEQFRASLKKGLK